MSGRAPRRYRGKDIIWWLVNMGFFDRTVDKLPSPQAKFGGNPHASGKNGGHTLNLHQFVRDGVTLIGRIKGSEGAAPTLAADVKDNLARIRQVRGRPCEVRRRLHYPQWPGRTGGNPAPTA